MFVADFGVCVLAALVKSSVWPIEAAFFFGDLLRLGATAGSEVDAATGSYLPVWWRGSVLGVESSLEKLSWTIDLEGFFAEVDLPHCWTVFSCC